MIASHNPIYADVTRLVRRHIGGIQHSGIDIVSNIIIHKSNPKLLVKALGALSCTIRGYQQAEEFFTQAKGLDVFQKAMVSGRQQRLFRASTKNNLMLRITRHIP